VILSIVEFRRNRRAQELAALARRLIIWAPEE
jgi:hypothetical protein